VRSARGNPISSRSGGHDRHRPNPAVPARRTAMLLTAGCGVGRPPHGGHKVNQGVENMVSATWAADTDEGTQHYRSHWELAWYRLRRNKAALLGATIVLLLVFAALFAPLLAPHDPNQPFDSGMTMDGSPTSPNGTFWFGADTLGRDLFSRILYGA